ncbi:MAG TPA: hypothetical protein VGQ44_00455 [Gemmatimonadaceae bacterium]|jgi:hypothetical protein|nr:hypothetical protein [Gemmatimonadaceae bacterium]
MSNVQTWMKTPAMRGAIVLLLAAIATVAWTLVHAVRAEPLPETPPSSSGGGPIKRAVPPGPADVQAAVESDLFSSDRSAPSAPYRMPGEKTPEVKQAAEPPKPTVLGTAVANDGKSFATLQLGDNRPTLVRVGDKIGEWVVKAIDRGKVTIINASGGRADLVVPKPGS